MVRICAHDVGRQGGALRLHRRIGEIGLAFSAASAGDDTGSGVGANRTPERLAPISDRAMFAGMTRNAPLVIDADYEARARAEMEVWQTGVLKGPSLMGRAARGAQVRINRIIPEKVHAAVTRVIEKMTRVIVSGSDLTTADPLLTGTLKEREAQVERRIAAYSAAASAGGGIAGAGGFALAMAEFPALIATKLKLLFDIAALYGHDGGELSERLYILHIFQLAFSSAEHRGDVFAAMEGWDRRTHPADLDSFEWRKFQQEYRDYIDLAKLLQMVPVIGAPVGAVVNYRLLKRLGDTAINAYRLRWLA